MLAKEAKIKILESFYSLDNIFFGKNIKKVINCCPILKEDYLVNKGALLQFMIEMFEFTKFSPKSDKTILKESQIQKRATASAKICMENAVKIIKSAKGKESVKKIIRESIGNKEISKKKLNKLITEKLAFKTLTIALDNMFINSMITESKEFNRLNSFEGRVMEDAYKVLRDSVVESALYIKKN